MAVKRGTKMRDQNRIRRCKRGEKENSRAPGDRVQINQRKGNKLSTTQVPKPLKVTSKYGNEVTMMSTEGVN